MKTTFCLAVALVALSPPAKAGSQGGVSGTATSPDGVPIRYDSAGKGDPTLVFVHCGGCNRGFWDGQMAYFSAQHRVVALDLAGHGQSGGGRKDWTMAAFGQDVASVVEALGLKRVVLIGHSLGGPAVLEAARRMPGRVAGLVLVDSWVDFEQRLPAEEVEKYVSALQADYKATTTAIVSQYFFSASTPEPVKARVLETVLSGPQEIGVAVARSSMAYDPLPALREIKAPICAISSDLFPTNLEGNRKYVPSYQAAIVKGTGHYLMLEQPEVFNELLAWALRELARSGGGR
ncbi:MAG TPA: alpha/beta hydrolase [Thermoanaerobaculia bacterium]|nr:alpha/beta hydrolase [Thermoanaerobaculia bacterium]